MVVTFNPHASDSDLEAWSDLEYGTDATTRDPYP